MDFPSTIRKTKPRETVWEILQKADGPLTAREIAQRAAASDLGTGSSRKNRLGGAEQSDSQGTPRSIWLSSVYRALEAFEKEHLITKTLLSDSAESIYALAVPGHHHYAICMGCKNRTELAHCPFAEEEALHTKDPDFMVVGHTIEVYGYCKECRKKMKHSSGKE